jgi:hypothetical protein
MSRLHQVRVRLRGGRSGEGGEEKGKGGGGREEGEETSSNASQPLAFLTTLSLAESHFAEYKCAWDTRFLRGDCTSSARLLAPVPIRTSLY